MKLKDLLMKLKIDRSPIDPIYFLIIFGQNDFIQYDYPKDFLEEISIKEKILPRTIDDVELVVSGSFGLAIEGFYKMYHKSREQIETILKFNGRNARFGLTIEQLKEMIERKNVM